MDDITKAFLCSSQFNNYGKGLLVLYAVSQSVGVELELLPTNIPKETEAEFKQAINQIDQLPDVVQLAFARALIDEIGSNLMNQSST